MYLLLCSIGCIVNAIVTIVSFILYIRTRLAPRERSDEPADEAQMQRLAELDRLESRYQSIHFISLALFVLFGILILVHLSNKLNSGTIL